MLLRVRGIMGLLLTLCVVLALPATARAFAIQEVTSPGGIKAWLVEEKAVPLMAMTFSFRSLLDPSRPPGRPPGRSHRPRSPAPSNP